MRTASKITLAKALSQVAVLTRRLFGLGPVAKVHRDGIAWELDLREGIDLALYLQVYERSTVAAYRRLIGEGNVVLDIGANVGAHAMLFAALVGGAGHVYAFEPTGYALTKLRRNLQLNPELAARVTALQCVVGDPISLPSELFASWPMRHASDADPQHGGRMKGTIGATALRLDDWAADVQPARVDFIKLDVDGGEGAVLRGGLETMRKYRPTVVMELAPYSASDPTGTVAELDALLRSARYRVGGVDGTPYSSLAHAASRLPWGASLNVIARPDAD